MKCDLELNKHMCSAASQVHSTVCMRSARPKSSAKLVPCITLMPRCVAPVKIVVFASSFPFSSTNPIFSF